jgi:hypothetical protein
MMQCSCGAKMCYLCKVKNPKYNHFHGKVSRVSRLGSQFDWLYLHTSFTI